MTATTTTWTPEARKIREAERAAARKALRDADRPWRDDASISAQVDALFPPPPPEYTYGQEIRCGVGSVRYRRRSDGVWEFKSVVGWRQSSSRSDAHVRALAAEVPFTDLECNYLFCVCSANRHTSSHVQAEALRFAIARVLRGEVK